MTVILDYGMGNLRSVERAIAYLGFESRIQQDLEGADRLIIPGVGAFGAAMERIEPLRAAIHRFVESGRPLLGICLGQQLLFDSSEELGEFRGLQLIRGRVVYFKDTALKIPHIGWNELEFTRPDPLSAGHQNGKQVYFVHSLYTECERPDDVLATSTYGVTFPAAVRSGQVWGVQFHPEKSGEVGLNLLRNFLTC